MQSVRVNASAAAAKAAKQRGRLTPLFGAFNQENVELQSWSFGCRRKAGIGDKHSLQWPDNNQKSYDPVMSCRAISLANLKSRFFASFPFSDALY